MGLVHLEKYIVGRLRKWRGVNSARLGLYTH